MQGLLGLGGFLLGAVPDHGVALRQVQVECDERPVLQAQRPEGGAIDLMEEAEGPVTGFLGLLPLHSPKKTGMKSGALNAGNMAVLQGPHV